MYPDDMSMHTAPVVRRLGRYELLFRLSSGGMGTVWLARMRDDLGHERYVALKTIHAHLATEPEIVAMFLDEARLASRINHPNVCTVLDAGNEDGELYLVMEHLVGVSLAQVVRSRRDELSRLAREPAAPAGDEHPWRAARMIADACEGLHAAHELTDDSGAPLSVLHRDVKPGNLFLTFAGVVKVLDFGVAKASVRRQHTQVGHVKGTVGYLAPEQVRGKTIDRRVDVWALGVCLWELLVGRSLFRRESDTNTFAAILTVAPPRPSSIERVPPELDDIVLTALAKNPSRRFPTARAFGMELARVITKAQHTVGAPELAEWAQLRFADQSRSAADGLTALRQGEVTRAERSLHTLAVASDAVVAEVLDEGSFDEVEPAGGSGAAHERIVDGSQRHPRGGDEARGREARTTVRRAVGAALAAGAAVALVVAAAMFDPIRTNGVALEEERDEGAPSSSMPTARVLEALPGAESVAAAVDAGVKASADAHDGALADAVVGGSATEPVALAAPAPVATPVPAPAPVASPPPKEAATRPPKRDARTGRIHVMVQGGWADVRLDGGPVGRTPLTVAASAGEHLVQLLPLGVGPEHVERVLVRPSAEAVVRIVLAPQHDVSEPR